MKNILVTGGVGFIGTNVAKKFLDEGYKVIAFDSLERPGVEKNLTYLQETYKDHFSFLQGDIRNVGDFAPLIDPMQKSIWIDGIIHLAGQPSIQKSLQDPMVDFFINTVGTLNMLELTRKYFNHVPFLFASCYDEKTKAFTKEGLKSFDQLKEGDIVLSINPKTELVEEKKIKKIIIQDYEGEMIGFKNRSHDLLVTPNHRMYIKKFSYNKNNNWQLDFKKSKLLNITVERADSFKHKNDSPAFQFVLPKGFCGEKKRIEIIEDNFPKQAKKIKQNFRMEDLLYLLGIYIGDGSLERQIKNGFYGKNESSVVFIHMPKKDRSRSKVIKTVKYLGLTPRIARSKANGEWGIFFSSKSLFKIFKECGASAKEKHIPEYILQYDVSLLKYVFSGLMDSDGDKTGRGFTTISKRLQLNFVELCYKLGLNACIRTVKNMESKLKSGRIIKPNYDGLRVEMSRKGPSLIIRGKHISKIFYSGKIWCVEVEDNRNLLVERNGKLTFCGNTDKVYSYKASEAAYSANERRYLPGEHFTGTDENASIDGRGEGNFHAPYGVSKLAADQYVQEYFAMYNMPTVVNRLSVCHGLHQQGVIDQGFSNFFVRVALGDRQLTLYGNGLQVRDLLDGRDAAELFFQEFVQIDKVKGQVFNVGGGHNNISLLEITDLIERLTEKKFDITFQPKRQADREYCVLNIDKVKSVLGWEPKISIEQTLKDMIEELQP